LELNFSDINIFAGTGSQKIGSERVKIKSTNYYLIREGTKYLTDYQKQFIQGSQLDGH